MLKPMKTIKEEKARSVRMLNEAKVRADENRNKDEDGFETFLKEKTKKRKIVEFFKKNTMMEEGEGSRIDSEL